MKNAVLGLLFSFFGIWLAGAFFCNDVNIDALSPGDVYQHRSEGWADTCIGEFGSVGSFGIYDNAKPKLIFLGDSFVEALQVSDDQKMSHQLSLIARGQDSVLVGVSVAHSGMSMADYYFKIRDVEKHFSKVESYCIILGQFEDTLPNQEIARYSQFSGELRNFAFNEKTISKVEGKKRGFVLFIHKWRLFAFKSILRDLLGVNRKDALWKRMDFLGQRNQPVVNSGIISCS